VAADELFPEAVDEDRVELSGALRAITFRNETNGYTVARVDAEQGGVTVVGTMPDVAEGDPLHITGRWVEHPHYGRQLQIERCELRPPSGRRGLVKYLGGGRIRGVGPKTAEKIVDRLGTDVLERLEHDPGLLATVPGISDVRAGAILRQLEEQRASSTALVFLQDHGLGAAHAGRVFGVYGADTIDVVRRNPYRLATDVFGIGFRLADGLARSLGVEADATFRVGAGLDHVLGLAANEGHVGLPFDELVARAAELLGVEPRRVEDVLVATIRDGGLVEDGLVYRPALLADERAIAAGLRDALSRAAPVGEGAMLGVPVEVTGADGPLALADDQREALRLALDAQVAVVTGGPGVGKTTIVRALVDLLRGRRLRTSLAAPTGRAARRLTEATGTEALTIHRLLGITPETATFQKNRDEPLELDALIVDEVSMVDVPLMAALVRALPPIARLVLVGDVDQLPSVGPGEVLRALIDSGVVPVARLSTIFRQAGGSGIVRVAHELNGGTVPRFDDDPSGQAFFVERERAQDVVDAIVALVRERIPRRFGLDPIRQVQVLTPMHSGPLGTAALNEVLREALNPGGADDAEVTRFGRAYRAGDKVMQVRNNYDTGVFNGDIGVVTEIDAELMRVRARFEERLVDYALESLDQLEPAYAITCHKSQGSEFSAVVMPLSTAHWIMLRRNLVYTAFTRARRVLVAVGEPRALQIAVDNAGTGTRHGRLRERLAGEA